MTLFKEPDSNYDKLFLNGCPQVLSYLSLKCIFKGLNLISSSASISKMPRCPNMGTRVLLAIGRYIPQFTQLLMKYVAREN